MMNIAQPCQGRVTDLGVGHYESLKRLFWTSDAGWGWFKPAPPRGDRSFVAERLDRVQ